MENKEFAGFWIRFWANFIDGLVLMAPMFVVNAIVYQQVLGMSKMDYEFMMIEQNSSDMYYVYTEPFEIMVWTMPITFILSLLFCSILTASNWQGTVGKRLLGLKVVDLEGNRLGFAHSLGRFFAYIPSGLILYLGYIMVGVTEKKQGLHDMIAKTYVIRTK